MLASVWDFLGGMFGTRAIEWIAATLGFINVWLIIRRNVWNYPFGIAMVVLYYWIFYEYKLYSDALLQVYFFFIQIIGWIWWLNHRDPTGKVYVERLSLGQAPLIATGAAAAVFALGYVMATYTDASLPYWDATTTVLSVIAQFLLAKRILESWIVWIAVDVLAIGIYIAKGLQPTAALYALFLILATVGLFTWLKAWHSGEAIEA